MESGLINIALYVTYILIGIAIIAVVVLPLIKAMDDPKSLIGTGIGLGILLVVFGISYALAGSEVLPKYADWGVDSGISKFVGGLLLTMYLFLGVAIVGILYTEVSKVLK